MYQRQLRCIVTSRNPAMTGTFLSSLRWTVYPSRSGYSSSSSSRCCCHGHSKDDDTPSWIHHQNHTTLTTTSTRTTPWNTTWSIFATSRPNIHHPCPSQQRRTLHISPRELSHLQLYQIGTVAQHRLANGILLNHPESVALISKVCMELIRSGQYTVVQLMEIGQSLLGTNNVMAGVPSMMDSVQIEATFPDGTKLLTIHSPITIPHGNMELALYGSFLTPPPKPHHPTASSTSTTNTTTSVFPGEMIPKNGSSDITLHTDRLEQLIEITVVNTGDRPIQVGSHYAFTETNRALQFDRQMALGHRLNIPSGTAIRFEPGESKRITLVPMGGIQNIVSGNRLHNGICSPERIPEMMENVVTGQFQHVVESSPSKGAAYVMSRQSYMDMYGPTVGDMIRLGDTGLHVRIEQDYNHELYGEECKFGGGKTIREGMGQSTSCLSSEALDTVITNCTIIDAKLGIVKADIGIKHAMIVGIGKAGNPDVQSNITPNMIIGNSTDVIGGEKLIVTAGYVKRPDFGILSVPFVR